MNFQLFLLTFTLRANHVFLCRMNFSRIFKKPILEYLRMHTYFYKVRWFTNWNKLIHENQVICS